MQTQEDSLEILKRFGEMSIGVKRKEESGSHVQHNIYGGAHMCAGLC